METKEIKTEKEVKPLKNKENAETSGSEENNQSKVKKKESHKNENKAWLSQRISELGEDKILYSSNSSGRHPYTREVLLLAELRGFKQVDMAEMCQVSQPQISQWLAGQSKATGGQLESLIDHISPLAPGKSFHIEEVVESVTLSLPDDWELSAVVEYLEKNANGMQEINVSNIQRYALEGVLAEERVALDELVSQHESANEDLLARKRHFEQLGFVYENAQVDFEEQIEAWEISRDEYLKSNPEFADLDEEKRGKILDRQFPMPVPSENEEEELIDAIKDALGGEVLDDSLDDSCKVVLDQITDELSALSESYKSKFVEETAKWLKEKEGRQVFGRYSKEYDLSSIVLSENLHAIEDEFNRLAVELYGDLKFTLAYEDTYGYSYSREDNRRREVELNMSEVFTEYCKLLCSRDNSSEQYIDIECEAVQICGDIIFGEREEKEEAEDLEEFEGVRCYRLFSNKLALVFGYEYVEGDINSRGVSDNYGYYKNIYVFDGTEDLLDRAEHLLTGMKNLDEYLDLLSERLVCSGYKTTGFRSIY
ncbi:MAG: hypothetical protein ACI9B7_000581 [Oleispira sp.]|jgi:hypothetical protein